jgi:hypothetical protein
MVRYRFVTYWSSSLCSYGADALLLACRQCFHQSTNVARVEPLLKRARDVLQLAGDRAALLTAQRRCCRELNDIETTFGIPFQAAHPGQQSTVEQSARGEHLG